MKIFGYVMALFTLILIFMQIKTLMKSRKKYDLFPVIAFLCMFIGDFFLNVTSYGTLHIASFALSLVFLTIGFHHALPVRSSLQTLGIIAVISAVVYAVVVGPSLPHRLGIHFFIYMALLTLLMWQVLPYFTAESVDRIHGGMLVLGATLFYIADVLVGIRILYSPPLINILIYSLYPPSLILLACAPLFRRDSSSRLNNHLF
jgi:hypothetical protein